jgi:hypothetical protein
MDQKAIPSVRAQLSNPERLVLTSPFGGQWAPLGKIQLHEPLIGTDEWTTVNIEVFIRGECKRFEKKVVFPAHTVGKTLNILLGDQFKFSNCWKCNERGEKVSDRWPFEFTGIQWVWNEQEGGWHLPACSDGVLRVLLE